jgi:hypothetical protein
MKNFFWFMHKPVDEREEALYGKAYRRALSVLWTGLAIILIVGGTYVTNRDKDIYIFNTNTAKIILLVLSYLSGWLLLRKEELSYSQTSDPLAPRFSKRFWFWLAVINAAVLLVMFINPKTYIVDIFVLVFGYFILLINWSWRTTRKFSAHVRILLTVFVPFIAIPLGLSQGKSLGRKVASVISFALGLVALPLIVIALVRLFIVFPVIINTTAFQPDLKQGTYMLVDKTARKYSQNDYAVVKDKNELLVVQVVAVNPDNLTVKTSSDQRTIPKNGVEGKIITGLFVEHIK